MAKNTKKSSQKLTELAIETLADNSASKTKKSLAASVLSQTNTSKQTGSKLESTASKVLHSDKYSDETKALAASVLSQSNKER
jgi:hypothetical protein